MDVEVKLKNRYLYKIEVCIIKYIPFILALICLLNTILSYYNIDLQILSYIGGISLLPLLFLYISSYVFKFCLFHRLPIYYITINWLLNIIDYYIEIPINDRYLFSLYLILTAIFIIISVYIHQYDRKYKKTICKDIKGNC